jgi:hypothetical protein
MTATVLQVKVRIQGEVGEDGGWSSDDDLRFTA